MSRVSAFSAELKWVRKATQNIPQETVLESKHWWCVQVLFLVPLPVRPTWIAPGCAPLTCFAPALHWGFPVCLAADAAGAPFLAHTEQSSFQILSPAQSSWDWYLQASQMLSFYTPVRVKVNKKEWDYRRNRDKSWPTKGTEILIFSWIFTSMLPCSVMSGRLPYGTFLTYLLIWRYYTLFCSAYKTCVHNEYHTVCLFYSEHNYLQKMVCFPRYKATLYSTLLTTCWTVILINTYHEKVFLFY